MLELSVQTNLFSTNETIIFISFLHYFKDYSFVLWSVQFPNRVIKGWLVKGKVHEIGLVKAENLPRNRQTKIYKKYATVIVCWSNFRWFEVHFYRNFSIILHSLSFAHTVNWSDFVRSVLTSWMLDKSKESILKYLISNVFSLVFLYDILIEDWRCLAIFLKEI